MGKPTGFLDTSRELPKKRPAALRILDFAEFESMQPEALLRAQGGRCMDCGVPFCQGGCPLGNLIPEWNDLVYRGEFARAAERLAATNNFPEFTGRLCPAPCEAACVLNLQLPNARPEAVTIKQIEKQIAESASLEPRPAHRPTNKTVAIVGSGPAGLAAAQELARSGHSVTVFERADKPGGLLRYGIPDFKLEKWRLDRRLEQLRAEGVVFRCGVEVGGTPSLSDLCQDYDAVLIATGATLARDLPVPGRSLGGIHLAMEYLTHANRSVAGEGTLLSAQGKRVVILGGGDTGSDCLGNATRQGAHSVVQLELQPRPPETQPEAWPNWPFIYRTSPAQEEGGTREFSVRTVRFLGRGKRGQVRGLECVRDGAAGGGTVMIPADLVLLALGFEGVEHPSSFEATGLAPSARGVYGSDSHYRTGAKGIFVCGDARRGASLIVWAIAEGRQAAAAISEELNQFDQ